MSQESLQLQLGDIVQIEAPTNKNLDGELFLIDYIDKSEIDIRNVTSLKKEKLMLDGNGDFEDTTIKSISLLSRDKELGYARQNGLLPKTWVSITFGGDLPAIISGEIANLEEDMIEVITFPEKQIIYIDFGYKGIPKNIPIKTIEKRDPPDLGLLQEEGEEVTPPTEEIIPEMKEQIKRIIVQADEIAFGPDLGEITQEVVVADMYERYGIQTQTNDLLDELLSTIPNASRTTKVLNKIHLMIERFKELRSIFSEKDTFGNPIKPLVKSAGYKPLVESLKSLNKNLGWILPVVKNKRKVYDVDESEAEMVDDVVAQSMAAAQIQDVDALDQYRNNTLPDSVNKYDYLLRTIQDIGTPYESPDTDTSEFITKQEVAANLSVVVDNLDDFYTSIVSKDMLTKKRYLIDKYNLGFNKLETIVESGSKPYNKLVKATPANKMYLKSFILMPEAAIRQSRVDLPGSSILVKSVLNRERKQLFKRFTKTTTINAQVIESFDTPIEHTFVKTATEILLDDALQDDPDKYEKYLQSIIPRTKILFNIVKKYIDEKLTLSEVVKEMEPFLVYSDDLTYNQYREMNRFIIQKINDYKKDYVASSRDYRILQSGKKFADKTWFSIFNILTHEKKGILDDSYGLKKLGFTSSENYHRIMDIDGGRLFMTTLAMENLLLMTPVDINDIFQREKLANMDNNTRAPKKNPCSDYVLVKRYLELDELLEDNGKDIMVDKNLDQTHYDIVNEYAAERTTMTSDDFEDFLKQKLILNIGLSEASAIKDARAMIAGGRKVGEGEYAVLEIDGGEKSYYYKRVGSQWERDETLPEVKMNESEFCNIQAPCIKVKEDCVVNAIASDDKTAATVKSMVDEFNTKYEVSKEELARLIQNRFAFFTYRLKVLKQLRFDEKTRINDLAIAMGEGVGNVGVGEITPSPYVKLRDAILGQQDLVKKNNDIVRFQAMFTRDFDDSSEEDNYWFYCKETNQKLIPVFIVTLAKSFIENQYNYVKTLEQICANQGKLSDDGNAWVDKHSGYVIKQVSFNTDEGFEETGFKSVSREIIQEDMRNIRAGELQKKFSDPNAEKINNVIQALGSYMGFSIEPMQEFIIRNTLLVTSRIVPSETEYNKKREAIAKKGKKIPAYTDAYNTSMMLVTFSFFLVGIQIAIPSIKTRKQFPGCKKSFSGFPMDGSGDDSAINYVACVSNKIKSSMSPWNVLKKMNAIGIAKRMKDIINKYVLPDAVIKNHFTEKTVYMEGEEEGEVPNEHNIAKWQTFLPPLVPIVTEKHDIDEYTSGLITLLKTNKHINNRQLSKVRSGLIHFPMIIIEEIQKAVQKELPLLTNIAQEAFLENACCIDKDEASTIHYFMKRIPSLERVNTIITQLHKIYRDINDITTAARIFSPINTRRVYPKLSSQFSEKTIYKAIIDYCRFGTLFSIPENLQLICMRKPDNFSLNVSLEEQIAVLKSDGLHFSLEQLNTLLSIVNRENVINISFYAGEISPLQKLRNYLNDDIQIIPKKLQSILKGVIDTFEIVVTEPTQEMKNLINYLDREINDTKANVVTFLQRNSKLSSRKFNTIIELLQTMGWRSTTMEMSFLKNQIYELTSVFPNMIINGVDYDDISLPKHWRKSLSERHISDIYNIINSYYKPLSKFKENAHLGNMLEHMTDKTQMWRDFVDVLPIFENIKEDGSIPSLNTKMVSQLLQYSLLKCLAVFINQTDNNVTGGGRAPVRESEVFEITTVNEIVDEEIGNISEIDIISGETLERSELMTTFLLDVFTIFGNTKRIMNYTYEDVIYRVNVSKEKEKDQFTRRLKDLTDEEREIENQMKNHKLGVWSKGLSKGVTQYERDNYDQERQEMEKIIAMERQVGKQDFVSDMNRDIFMSEAAEAARGAAEIEAEEDQINYMGEDADYDEFGMDGDEFF